MNYEVETFKCTFSDSGDFTQGCFYPGERHLDGYVIRSTESLWQNRCLPVEEAFEDGKLVWEYYAPGRDHALIRFEIVGGSTKEDVLQTFEEYYSKYSGQTLQWVKEKRNVQNTGYRTGHEISGYWLAFNAGRQNVMEKTK